MLKASASLPQTYWIKVKGRLERSAAQKPCAHAARQNISVARAARGGKKSAESMVRSAILRSSPRPAAPESSGHRPSRGKNEADEAGLARCRHGVRKGTTGNLSAARSGKTGPRGRLALTRTAVADSEAARAWRPAAMDKPNYGGRRARIQNGIQARLRRNQIDPNRSLKRI